MNDTTVINKESQLVNIISKIKENVIAMDVIVGIFGATIISLTARISIPLWFTPVPITGQTLGAIGCILAMKRYRAILSTLFYIIFAMLGLPVLASQTTGLYGISWLTKPVSEVGFISGASIGYVYGFLLAAIICKLVIRNKTTILAMTISTLIFTIVTYVCGVFWLQHSLHPLYGTPFFGGPNSAFALGCWPFLIGDLLKSALGIGIAKSYKNSTNKK